MSDAVAGYKTGVAVCVMEDPNSAGNPIAPLDHDNANWFKLPTTGPVLNFGADSLDTTTTDMEAFKRRIHGLKDWSVQADSNYDSDVAAGPGLALQHVRDSILNDSDIWVRFAQEGHVSGKPVAYGKCIAETFNQSGSTGDKATVSITLQADGVLTYGNFA